MYCTRIQARAAGVTGTDLEVDAWIALAQVRVDRYTQQVFEPTDLVIAADVAPSGLVLLPRRVRTVASVTAVSAPGVAPVVLPSTSYLVTSSAVIGDVDAVHLAAGCGYDDLVVGAESWNGGWPGLLSRWGCKRVTVAGSFGFDSPPAGVPEATALLAAFVQAITTGLATAGGSSPQGGIDVDDEGNNVAIERDNGTDDDDSAAATPASTTGLASADALLAPWIAGPPMLAGV